MKLENKLEFCSINYQLSPNEMLEIQAGVNKAQFCAGFTAGALIYGAGILLNQWNPLGWGADVAILAGTAYCI
jgi:hypothetical protein